MNFGRRIQIGATLKPELLVFVHFSVSRFDSLKISLDIGLPCSKIILIEYFYQINSIYCNVYSLSSLIISKLPISSAIFPVSNKSIP